MSDRCLRERRPGAGRQSEQQPPYPRLGRFDTNSDLSDIDDRYELELEEDDLLTPFYRQNTHLPSNLRARPNNGHASSFDSLESSPSNLAQINSDEMATNWDHTSTTRSTPRRRRKQFRSPPMFRLGVEDSAGALSGTAGSENSGISSSQVLVDEDTLQANMTSTSGYQHNTRSGVFGTPPSASGSGLFGSGQRGVPNSPAHPGSHNISPRRSRMQNHRRIGSGSENLMPHSLSHGSPNSQHSLHSLGENRGNSHPLGTRPDFTHNQRRSERAYGHSTNSSTTSGNVFFTPVQRYNGNYLSDLNELSQGEQSDPTNSHPSENFPPLRRHAVSQASRDRIGTATTVDRLDPWVDSESEGGEDWEGVSPYLSNQEYEDPLFSFVPNRGNSSSRRTNQIQAMQVMRERLGRWSSENNFVKRPRDKADTLDGNSTDLMSVLEKKGATTAVLYHSERPQSGATDVWPDIRDSSKAPSRYFPMSDKFSPNGSRLKRRGLISTESLRPSWPRERLPTEMFEEIASYLSRDDIKSMRLVCREFDKHVSQVLFKTVVVPFNTEIYGMLGQDIKPDYKGKGKIKVEVNKPLSWKNANGDDVYNGHGLDVFRGFGPHIRKYGMSFDVDEDALAKPPFKGTTERHTTFWGEYQWPFEEYRRFDDVAGLELAADETPKMKTAFSMLEKVQELALSLDSGLGWLKGPDRSIRARIIRKQPEVFGSSKDIPDRKEQAQQELWHYIERVHREAQVDLKTATMYRMAVNIPLKELKPIIDANAVLDMSSRFPYLDPRLIAEATLDDYTIEDRRDDAGNLPTDIELVVPEPVLTPSPSVGVLYSSGTLPSDVAQLRSSIIPTKLSKAQKEWLMETEWAQRAFLSSYMLAIMDNPLTFETVHTLNVARISSRYTSALCREDFWDALPQLKTITIQVLPDWRNVVKDEAGFVETPRIDPRDAIEPFYQLLKEMINPRKNIKKLTIGWAAGGEHAEGIHARNKHVLPAPLLLCEDTLNLIPSQLQEAMLSFPHVECLTLRNCWITPPALRELVKKHDQTRLRKLTLESVSLTAMPRALANQNANQNANPIALQVQQPLNVNGNLNLQNHLQVMANAHAQNQVQNIAAGNQQNINAIQLAALAAAPLQQPGGIAPPPQLIALQIQALQLQIHHLQNQQGAQAQAQLPNMQAQLQAHIQVQNNLQGQVPQAPAPPPQVNAQSAVRTAPREGSWPYILDIISPGQNLGDFGSTHSNADADRKSNLRELELVSCGYVRLPHASIDEAGLEPAHPFLRHPFFSKRYNALAPAMLSSKDPLMGEIVQEIDAVEVAAVNAAWFLTTGWEDEGESRAVEFDGCLKGGEGRFSGVLRKSDRVSTGGAQ